MIDQHKADLDKLIEKAQQRHLKRTHGNLQDAWDLTYHHLKHFGLDEESWDYVTQQLDLQKGQSTDAKN